MIPFKVKYDNHMLSPVSLSHFARKAELEEIIRPCRWWRLETGDNPITSVLAVNLALWLGLGSLSLRASENSGEGGGVGVVREEGGPIDWKLFIGEILLLRKIGKIGQKNYYLNRWNARRAGIDAWKKT